MTARRKITRVCVANRGEIARRIIRTCSKMGIETVALYTTVEEHAPHVREASTAEPIGPSSAYLDAQAVIEAAKRAKADAIHPGYGFLSENADFAADVEKAGITWIGPSAESIRKLGSKTAAKELALNAKVPMSPTLLLSGKNAKEQVSQIVAFGKKVGFPLIIKAAAGGGGRGMRFINDDQGIESELESARRESKKAFGSDEVFVEKCITPARHVEVQIAADSQGVAIALGSRDCSLQRSNQKIIEEAPALHLAAGVEAEMFKAACALAKVSGYTNLGTVEFLYGSDGGFYFLEVNTRLQVEHPVTEAVTGLDLVELQIRLARGESLAECGITPTPKQTGHAIEARWCAEEYTTTFVTSTGVVLDAWVPPTTKSGAPVRFDSAVEPCTEVTHHYDSLIGKIIVHASDRTKAISALDETLSQSRISGVKTNRSLLLHLLRTKEFRSLTHSVQGTAKLLPSAEDTTQFASLAHAVAAAIRCATPLSTWVHNSPWIKEFTAAASLTFPWTTSVGSSVITSSTKRADSGLVVSITTPPSTIHTISIVGEVITQGTKSAALISLNGGTPFDAIILRDARNYWIHLPSGTAVLHEEMSTTGTRDTFVTGSGSVVRSTIPGRVAAISVTEGAPVQQGDVMLVLDSMKMEHPIRAPIQGTISSLPCKVDAIVQSGSILVVIDPV